jgi:hypothetical protein
MPKSPVFQIMLSIKEMMVVHSFGYYLLLLRNVIDLEIELFIKSISFVFLVCVALATSEAPCIVVVDISK